MSPRSESECIPEAELFELFRPRRADAEAFRRGVQRHIEEKREASEPGTESKAAEEPRAPAWLRRAAALVIGDPLAGALGGAAAGKVAGAKLLPAALALPAVLLGSAVGAFVVGVRSLRRSARDAEPYEPPPKRPRLPANRDLAVGTSLMNALQLGYLLLLLGAPLLGGALAVDVLFLVLLVSMAALAFCVRGFARAGLLERAGVARLCAGVLGSTFMGCFLWQGSFNVPDSASELGIGWSVAVVMLGIPVCLAYTGLARSLLAVLGWSVFLLLLNPLACTRTSPGQLRDQLAAMELEPLDLSNWRQAGALNLALSRTGHPVPDLAALRSALAAEIEREDPELKVWKAGEDVHPQVWTTALQMGLVDAEHRARLSRSGLTKHKLEELRSGTRPLFLMESDEYLYWLLRDDAGFAPGARATLAGRLEAAWPEVGEHGALGKALLCVRALELLGLPERVEGLRERARSLVVAHWVPSTRIFGNAGGFSPNPRKFRTSFDDETWFAIELMARFGMPPEIDARLLRGHLRTESRAKFFDAMPELEAFSRAALLELEEEIGLPPRNVLQRVLDERLFLTSVLIVALCLLAIRLAPALEARPGAQP